MSKSALRVEECCAWCRRPIQRCRDASCDDAPTYGGVLLRGVWNEVREGHIDPTAYAAAPPSAAA